MIQIQFMTLVGKFAVEREETFATTEEAMTAVKTHAATQGFTGVKMVDNSDMDSIRFTARTPNGRAGRNVAMGDLLYTDEEMGYL